MKRVAMAAGPGKVGAAYGRLLMAMVATVAAALLVVAGAVVALGSMATAGMAPAIQPARRSPAQPAAAAKPTQPPAVGDVIDLSGAWKFRGDWTEGGIAEGWQNPTYDDASWKELQVPASWESQGVTTSNPRWPTTEEGDGYNGYAWYRKHVTIPAQFAGTPVTIELGAIDDNDWTYVNGTLVGSMTSDDAAGEAREYTIPTDALRFGSDNVVAVRVLDKGGEGGIVDGPVQIRRGRTEEQGAPTPDGTGEERAQYTHESSDVVRMGSGVTIPADQKVVGDVVCIGGTADVYGYVTGSVVAVGGSVHARSGARIGGDAVAVGGQVEKEEGAIISGQTVTGMPAWKWRSEWARGLPRPFERHAGFFPGLLVWVFISLLAMLLLRRRLDVMADALPLHPGRAAGYGLAGIALSPAALITALLAEVFAIIVLIITIVGILAIPAVAMAMLAVVLAPAAVMLAGVAGVFLALGRAVLLQLHRPGAGPIWTLITGVFTVCLLGLIPVLGHLIWLTVAIFGFGVAIMTGVGSAERWSHRDLGWRRRHVRQADVDSEAGLSPSLGGGQPLDAATEEHAGGETAAAAVPDQAEKQPPVESSGGESAAAPGGERPTED
ncbi:MAG: sugar-binding domain-containing protein [Armatimonadota bacterium]